MTQKTSKNDPLPVKESKGRRLLTHALVACAGLAIAAGAIAWEQYQPPPSCGDGSARSVVSEIMAEHVSPGMSVASAGLRDIEETGYEERAPEGFFGFNRSTRFCRGHLELGAGSEAVAWSVQWLDGSTRQRKFQVQTFETVPGCAHPSVTSFLTGRLEAELGPGAELRAAKQAGEVAEGARPCEGVLSTPARSGPISYRVFREQEDAPEAFRTSWAWSEE